MPMLTISGDQFLWDDQPFRILSGSIHYFRVVPQYWQDRLKKLKDFGLNTVETYVPWNLHEPEPTEFNFKAGLDLRKFIEIAGSLDLKVIVRPGPFICAEWDFGGLPYWLLKDPRMQVRSSYAPFLETVQRYFDQLLPILTPLQSSNGGPIIAMQLENEYGGYGNDLSYLASLYEMMTQRGVNVLMFTSDIAHDGNLQAGILPGLLPTINLSDHAPQKIQKLREYYPKGPLMVTEFWSGWFDDWGQPHHPFREGVTLDESVQALDDILAAGASVNFYMFHGGTNFGFMNGANAGKDGFHAHITSYDYGAPLSEWGEPSASYLPYRAVLEKYADLPPLPTIAASKRKSFGEVLMSESVPLWDVLDDLSKAHQSVAPLAMEEYHQDYGFILYRTYISGPRDAAILAIHGLHDRAQVFLDGDQIAVLERETGEDSVQIEVPPSGSWLDILVENMGRVNYGLHLFDAKGITAGVSVDEQYVFQWQVYPLPLKYISPYLFQPVDGQLTRYPMFYRAEFEVDEPADTFLDPRYLSKGVAWVNGFNLGRYWNRGPQKRLYIPAPLLRPGKNDIVLLELHDMLRPFVELTDQPG